MAVMDGKALTHRICAMDHCREPLVDYKSGCFCHLHLENENHGNRGLDGLPFRPDQEDAETDLGHTFRARRTYCVQTIQWACGMPIGWGKCYEIESVSQVLQLVNFWFPPEGPRPAFIVYDNACKLLAHIVTQNTHDLWLTTTRFVVDAWHYINHRSTDHLCREWCNPAPLNGSQPDLVILERDGMGQMRASRAFNTEVAEQFNAWMDGFESQLRQMTDFNFDFFLHSVMLLYKEEVEQRVESKQRGIPNY
ncbi:hypothetical protein JB92DRAFT_3274289 [Gautieria morchelliformis]|nr:hypothetical protein JB92DRAFT_3274289 [Gautieria morchelliformis]